MTYAEFRDAATYAIMKESEIAELKGCNKIPCKCDGCKYQFYCDFWNDMFWVARNQMHKLRPDL